MQNKISWALAIFVAFVFIQSLFFKFTGSDETVIIFSTISEWMEGNFLAFIAPLFNSVGGYAIGGAELVASALILYPATRHLGALLGLGVMSGAIFFHLFTPLGVDRVINEAGDTDGGALFFMACGVWLSCLILLGLWQKARSAAA